MDKTLHIQPCIFFYLLNFCKRKLSGRDDSASSKLFYQSRPMDAGHGHLRAGVNLHAGKAAADYTQGS